MVNLIRITEPTDIRLQKLIPLYKEAFPEEERRNIKQLERCFGRFVYLLGYAGFLLP